MRQHPGGLNRAWLTVVGLVVILAGVIAAAIALGLLGSVLAATRAPVTAPAPTDSVLAPGIGDFLDQQPVVIGVGILGVLLAVLGLLWLVAQIPRTNAAKPFRLHDDATRGLTVVQPDALTGAVEAEVEVLPGVTKVDAVLRGTAAEPELTVQVAANDRADIAGLLHSLQTDIAAHLATALGRPLKHLAVQVDITTTRRTADHVIL